jgi:hypothetical protein
MQMNPVKSLNNLKNSVISFLLVVLVGGGIGTGLTFYILQKNLDTVCGLVSARNQFINFVKQDSK